MKYLFEWSDDLSVNQPEIDRQHKQLFNQINILLSAIIIQVDEETVDDAISFLGKYINNHLTYEEDYMAKNGYPDLEQHKLSHQDFVNNYKIVGEKRRAGAPVESLALQIEQYLGNWLIEHIGQADQKFAEYIERKTE